MQDDAHSFSRTFLCRRFCDRCRRVIRLFGVRCKACRLKCHKKCSTAISTRCESQFYKVNPVTCHIGRFWRRNQEERRKWPLDSNFDPLQARTAKPENTNQSLRPRKYIDAKGKIRQKLINGLYDSFCYSPRHGLDLYPKSIGARSPTRAANVTVHRERTPSPCRFQTTQLTLDVDLAEETNRRALNPNEHFLPPPHPWTRTYSWSSKTSAMTSFTSSSGYSSMPASCPSSANSHRSTSPTPDFSNIRSLTATLERCSLEEGIDINEEDGFSGEEDWDKSLPVYSLPATWPLSRKNGQKQRDTRRIFSVDDCQTTSGRRYCSRTHSESPPYEEKEDYMKKSLKEWNIPYSDLQFGDVVGVGPKGHVYKGRWHGEIMIHTVKKSTKPDLEAFLKEVSLLSMIRHENVVLFMGACLEPPNLAFITSVRKGLSLHIHLHVRQDFFPLCTRISIARQIAQGMSYLHAKGIVLPRLNSMNVFLESKVKLCVTGYAGRKVVERPGYASIPRGHLTYIPPEHMRTLTWSDNELVTTAKDSVQTNVYVFGFSGVDPNASLRCNEALLLVFTQSPEIQMTKGMAAMLVYLTKEANEESIVKGSQGIVVKCTAAIMDCVYVTSVPRYSMHTVFETDYKYIVVSMMLYGNTVLYEIMTSRWPFSCCSVECIIWMVGKGQKQCLKHMKCPENIKVLIRECWSENPEDRPDFSKIVQFFQEQNIPPESTHKRITGSFSEPEKMHKVGRTSKLSIR